MCDSPGAASWRLRRLKEHALVGARRTPLRYRLTAKGIDVALLFLFFHKRFCGRLPTAPCTINQTRLGVPDSKLEVAYHKADKAIENIVKLLKVA